MYVPPYQSLMRNLEKTNASSSGEGCVTIPLELFKMLLQIAVVNSDFNEDTYFKENPDVREAVRRGDIESGHMHFVGFGYFEGRKGGVVVDETWYLRKYPDVATAVRSGQVPSASDHFHSVGGGEGRSPSADQESAAAQWKNALALK